MLVQPRRDKSAALGLLRRLLKRQGLALRTIVTDRLRSYWAALRDLGFAGHQEQGLRANNRAESSHQPIRRRERKMQRSNRPNRRSGSSSDNAAAAEGQPGRGTNGPAEDLPP